MNHKRIIIPASYGLKIQNLKCTLIPSYSCISVKTYERELYHITYDIISANLIFPIISALVNII